MASHPKGTSFGAQKVHLRRCENLIFCEFIKGLMEHLSPGEPLEAVRIFSRALFMASASGAVASGPQFLFN